MQGLLAGMQGMQQVLPSMQVLLSSMPGMLVLLLLLGVGGATRCSDEQDCDELEECKSGWVMGEGGCEPCIETGTAYFGSNLLNDPVTDVENEDKCRAMCLATNRCNYFTYDVAERWCYLKHNKSKTLQQSSQDLYISRFISGTKSCSGDEENEIEENKHREEENTQDNKKLKKMKIENAGIPLLSIQNPEGYRTVLSTLPATFGMKIDPGTKVSGRVEFSDPPTLCSSSQRDHPSFRPVFVAVDRGGCKFTDKAKQAALAGYGGVIVMDNKNNTNVKKISGTHLPQLDRIPVLFLLKKEADIFRNLIKENPDTKIIVEDSSTFTWSGRRTTSATTKKPVVGMRDPGLSLRDSGHVLRDSGMRDPLQWLLKQPQNFRNRFVPPRRSSSSSRPDGKHGQTVATPDPVVKTYSSSWGLAMTPLTLGSLVVGVVLGLLLLISVGTLIIGRHNRKARRRAHTTRCQIAIRDFERHRQSQDNSGFRGDEEGGGSADHHMPNSAKYLLECPVCLDLAWPPTRIFQCREGHIVCENCKANSNLRVCPMCRIPLTNNNVSRNRQLEELARTLLLELDDTEAVPSAPPVPSISASIPHNVFNVDPQLNVMMEREEEEWIREFGMETTGTSEGVREEHIADIVLEPRPLTVMLPPELNTNN